MLRHNKFEKKIFICYNLLHIKILASFMAQENKRLLIDTLMSTGIHSKKEVAIVAGVSLATVYNVIAKKKSPLHH